MSAQQLTEARRDPKLPEGRGGLQVRFAIALATVIYAFARFGWSAGALVLAAATIFVLLDWLQYPERGRRSLAFRFLLISVQLAIVFAIFFAPRPIGFASEMPTPMVLKTPFLVLLLCFMASHISAARPLITIWASLSVVAGWWLAREVIRADPHTITAANLVLSHYKTYLELARVAGQPHFFNGGVWSIHFRELFIFGAILAFAAYRVHHLAIRTARQAALRDALGAHFAPQVAELMAKSSKPGLMRWSKELAVIDCDMISFTALAEKSEPEHVAEILQAYRNVVEDAVFDAGGAIVSYAGDGATAVFGLTDGGAPAAVAALDCAQQIANGWPEVARIVLGTDAAAVAIGIDFGAVRAGLVGEGRALSLLLLGEPVAGAAELQAMTRDRSVLILLSEAEKQAVTAEKPGLADNLLPVDAKGTTAWGLRNG